MRVKVNYLDNLQAGAGLWFRLLFSYETETQQRHLVEGSSMCSGLSACFVSRPPC